MMEQIWLFDISQENAWTPFCRFGCMSWQVKRSLFSGGSSIIEKNDQTPVTIADFGVQALISLGNP